jgi:hypothetical protein
MRPKPELRVLLRLLRFLPFSGKRLILGGSQWSECIAMVAFVLYFQTRPDFPSWTSRVRVPSPAPCFQQVSLY